MPVPLYLTSFLIVGLSITFIGPALSELRERSGSDIGGIGVLFVGQSIGYIFGSVLGGRLYDRFTGHRIFGAALLTIGAGMALLPVWSSIPALFAVFVLMGIGSASADIGANTLLLWSQRTGADRAMNTLHLCFGIGALTSPIFVHVGLDLAARLAAVFCVLIAVWAFMTPSPTSPLARRTDQTETTNRLLFVVALFFFLYVGLELGFSGWVKTYGEEIQLSDLAATWLTTVFWIGFTGGRLLSSVTAQRFRPKVILTGASALSIVAGLVLVVADGRTGPLWAGTAVMGVATAPQFPVMLTYLERRIQVTGSATSWFVGAAGLGGLAFPWLIGRWFDASGATAVPLATLLLAVATVASFALSDRLLGG